MRVVFQKQKRDLCVWTAYPPKRRPVSALGGTGRAKIRIPHDLAQLVIERELGYRHGFWGCVGDGATFKSLVQGGRRRTRPGRAIIATHVHEIDEAEHAFHSHVDLWLARSDTPALASLDEAYARWSALEEHGVLEEEFPLTRSSRTSPRPVAARQ